MLSSRASPRRQRAGALRPACSGGPASPLSPPSCRERRPVCMPGGPCPRGTEPSGQSLLRARGGAGLGEHLAATGWGLGPRGLQGWPNSSPGPSYVTSATPPAWRQAGDRLSWSPLRAPEPPASPQGWGLRVGPPSSLVSRQAFRRSPACLIILRPSWALTPQAAHLDAQPSTPLASSLRKPVRVPSAGCRPPLLQRSSTPRTTPFSLLPVLPSSIQQPVSGFPSRGWKGSGGDQEGPEGTGSRRSQAAELSWNPCFQATSTHHLPPRELPGMEREEGADWGAASCLPTPLPWRGPYGVPREPY